MLEDIKNLTKDRLETMVVSELKELARELKISGVSAMKKDLLVEKIIEASEPGTEIPGLEETEAQEKT